MINSKLSYAIIRQNAPYFGQAKFRLQKGKYISLVSLVLFLPLCYTD